MIRFYCKCGQKIKVDDVHAGKKGRCPKCKGVVLIPHSSEEEIALEEMLGSAEPNDLIDTLDSQEDAQPYVMAKEAIPTKPCPYCGKDILAIDHKCQHCGKSLRARAPGPMRVSAKPRVVAPKGNKWSAGKMTFYVLCALFVPIPGVIIGIVGLTRRGKRRQGLVLLLLAVVVLAVGSVVIISQMEGYITRSMQDQIKAAISEQDGVTCSSVTLVKDSSNGYKGLATLTTGKTLTVTIKKEDGSYIFNIGD